MTFGQLVHEVFADKQLAALALLVVADLILGILAAFKLGTFRLSYVSDFLRNDVLFKVVPYFFLKVAATVAGAYDIVVDNFDWGLIAGGAYIIIVLALVGSLLKSVADLGLMKTLAAKAPQLFGAENAAPPKD